MTDYLEYYEGNPELCDEKALVTVNQVVVSKPVKARLIAVIKHSVLEPTDNGKHINIYV